jgi:L-cysteine:1D-myo-inositol 2-amino-2-deoxy-alpha-D-glucopyranoside ligase
MRELGTTIDLHGGGRDLVFPHHECEAAQSESVTGTTFCRHWLHVGMVGLGGEKMSKSLGNLVFVGDLLKDWEPSAIRLALLEHHYRADWDWTTEGLEHAAARLERWRLSAGRSSEAGTRGQGVLDEVRSRLDDDLDAPGALRVLDEAAGAGGDVRPGAALLGVSL